MSPLDFYKSKLAAISARTGTPLPSLLFSFAVVHEVTALVPLVGGFYAARSFGFGNRIISALGRNQETPTNSSARNWALGTAHRWITEGEAWAGRVGRRYGVFGIEKGAAEIQPLRANVAGDVANAVFAYGFTKSIFPLRMAFSAYLAPSASRRIIEPIRRSIMRAFTKGRG